MGYKLGIDMVGLPLLSAPSLYWLLHGILELAGSGQLSEAPAVKNARPDPAELHPPSPLLGHLVWLTMVAPSIMPLPYKALKKEYSCK